MRITSFLMIVCTLGVASLAAHADALLDDFKVRIEAALAIGDEDKRAEAVSDLFYREDINKWSERLAKRTINHLVELNDRKVSFEPLRQHSNRVHVRNGYEYRPNIEPLGYVVFDNPAGRKGNKMKAPYGLPPDKQRYYLPITVRKLANPDAPPDKQFQILTIGIANPPVTFKGWCNIALSNKTIKRVTLNDRKVGNQTRVLRGQSIEQCSVTNTAGRGSLKLRLQADRETIFERRIEAPETTITYRKQ